MLVHCCCKSKGLSRDTHHHHMDQWTHKTNCFYPSATQHSVKASFTSGPSSTVKFEGLRHCVLWWGGGSTVCVVVVGRGQGSTDPLSPNLQISMNRLNFRNMQRKHGQHHLTPCVGWQFDPKALDFFAWVHGPTSNDYK